MHASRSGATDERQPSRAGQWDAGRDTLEFVCGGGLYAAATTGCDWSVRDRTVVDGRGARARWRFAGADLWRRFNVRSDGDTVDRARIADTGDRHMNIDFPFHFDARGRTATTGTEDHVRDLIEQLLFTNPGERVNRPEFGSGLKQLIFAPNGHELGTALQFTVQASLERYLGDLIELEKVEVTNEDSRLELEIAYRLRRSGQAQTARFVREV
jgi:uncharacterized protein